MRLKGFEAIPEAAPSSCDVADDVADEIADEVAQPREASPMTESDFNSFGRVSPKSHARHVQSASRNASRAASVAATPVPSSAADDEQQGLAHGTASQSREAVPVASGWTRRR